MSKETNESSLKNEGVASESKSGGRKSDVFDQLMVLVTWRRFIVFNTLSIFAISLLVSLLLPKWYRSSASILPPKETDVFGSLGAASSVLKGLTSGKVRGLGQSQGTYNSFAILRSRTATEAVIRKFDLMNVYEIEDSSMERAIKTLEQNTAFELQDDDNITIDVLDKNPQRAAAIANYYVELLNEMSIALGTREARNNREFIEKRLQVTRDDLRRAEDSLQVYQERSGLIVSVDPSTSGVSPIAELYGLKARKEIELAILRRSVAKDNAALKQIELELNEIGKKLNTFPSVGVESLRLYRDVLIHQKILEFLVPVYEQAKVDEQKDVPVLLVLDRAMPSERKAKPQRLLLVFLATTLGLFVSVFLVFLMHGVQQTTSGGRQAVEKTKAIVHSVARLYRLK
jgi:tyrosine-protein kinase Etk/Wzc